ncbi:MAG: hypothetical protein ABI885_20295, partial [Gammaproteobacteria bacterium]
DADGIVGYTRLGPEGERPCPLRNALGLSGDGLGGDDARRAASLHWDFELTSSTEMKAIASAARRVTRDELVVNAFRMPVGRTLTKELAAHGRSSRRQARRRRSS